MNKRFLNILIPYQSEYRNISLELIESLFIRGIFLQLFLLVLDFKLHINLEEK